MTKQLSKYGYIRLAVISPEIRPADIEFNTKEILSLISLAIREKCQIVLFPELSITGYSCGDLFFQSNLLKKAKESIGRINEALRGKKIVVVVGASLAQRGKLFNCAVVLHDGNLLGIVPKTYLCNSGEYYEERWFSSEFDRQSNTIRLLGQNVPFGTDIVFEQDNEPNVSFGIEICEDLWAIKSPSLDLAISGANIILNLSASNEFLTKHEYRSNLVNMQSARCLSVYAMASSGANESSTDTVFSGHSIIAENGIILKETSRFQFDSQIAIADVDIERISNDRQKNNSFGNSKADRPFRTVNFSLKPLQSDTLIRKIIKSPFVPEDINVRKNICGEIFSLQTTGLLKRLRHIGSKSVVVGVSGGLDSTLALLVAVEAFKKSELKLKSIIAVSMPGPGTSERTQGNAKELAKLLGINFKYIPINNALKQHLKDIEHISKNDIVFENAQARERTQILMDLANKLNGIVIGTGDLSEIALGWSTYNADHMSMYNVNSGIPKTLVKYVITWAAEEKFKNRISKILTDICNTPISPELLIIEKKGVIKQKTEDIIGPYDLHDFFLYYSIRMGFSPRKIFMLTQLAFKGFYTKNQILKWMNVFYRRFFDNQFKRSCMPDGVKIGTVSLSPRADWRMPSDVEKALWLEELDSIAIK